MLYSNTPQLQHSCNFTAKQFHLAQAKFHSPQANFTEKGLVLCVTSPFSLCQREQAGHQYVLQQVDGIIYGYRAAMIHVTTLGHRE